MGSSFSTPRRAVLTPTRHVNCLKEALQVHVQQRKVKIAEALVSSLIETHGHSGTVQEVNNELRMILDFLRNKKLGVEKKLQYLIDDLVDMVQLLSRGGNTEKKLGMENNPREYSNSLKSWLGEMRKRMLLFGDDGVEIRSENVEIEGDNEDEDVVTIGLEEDMEQLLRKAIFSVDQPKIKHRFWAFSITGVAGIGKTTLARQVYNHPDTVHQFQRRAWVHVSNDLTNKEVLMKLIQQVVDVEELERDPSLEEMESADNRSLQLMLHEHLQGMQYFIVLDDVPNEMGLLQSILRGLPNEDKGSRLLLTSRTGNIKRGLYNYIYNHEMKPLDFEQSWQLFLSTVFCGNKSKSEHKFPKQLEKNGRDMLLAQCSGVPLAIKEVGRLLAEKRQLGIEWEQLLQPTDFHLILEALLLLMIQNVMSNRGYRGSYEHIVVDLAGDLRKMVDFVRDEKLQEGSKLSYWLCDVVDMVQYLDEARNISAKYVQSRIKNVERCISDFRVAGAETVLPIISENFGEEDNEVVVGLEKDVELLLKACFTKQQDSSQTVLITGMIGIGKTTLARRIYNHPAVVDRYDRHAWVCVSTNFSHKKVLMKIIQQVVHCEEFEREALFEKMERPDNFCLRRNLRKHLKGMRYLIVLDNFPKELCLEYIMEALPLEGEGSLLLITSRSPQITYNNVCTDHTHRMKALDPDKSWQLFLKTLSSELKFPKHLVNKGRAMLRKCGGVPLAIIEVGKQVTRRRQSGSEWEEVLDSIDFGTILAYFESIYHNLDPRSKESFLHMAFFKEMTTIRNEKLRNILSIVENASIANIRANVGILVEQFIVEIKDKKSCLINAILHMLSIEKAKEEIGFEIRSSKGSNRPSKRICHLVVSCGRDEFNYSSNQDNLLVSLFFHGGGYFNLSPSYWKSFELLEILDLEEFGLKILPENIGALMKLRYLGLRNNYVQEIPQSLGSLKDLEVLDIAQNFLVEVSDIIWEMSSLCHLYMSDVICRKPLKIDRLRNLETLTYISVDNWVYELSGLQMMINLRKLGIEELDENSDVSKLFASLAESKFPTYLILKGFRFRSMPCLDELHILESPRMLKLDGLIARLPSAGNFPPNIVHLTLVNSCLDEDPMPVLEKLPYLTHLKLRNAYTGREMVILHIGFYELKVLCIEQLWNLRNVRVGKGAMWRINKLEIKCCPYLEILPEEIGSLTRLEELKMVTTKNIATIVRKSALISKIRVVEINA